VSEARSRVAELLHATERELVFTSGATESNNLSIKGLLRRSAPGSHMITNTAEHRAVLDPARKMRRSGFKLTVLKVDSQGFLDPEQVRAAILPNTVLVSVMWANNEIGTINDIATIAKICHQAGVVLHCDAVQAAGRIPIDVRQVPVDLLSISGHKFYGPKGIGVLYRRHNGPVAIPIDPLFDGGGHENRLRSGTLPVPLIVGLGHAAELAADEGISEQSRLAGIRDRLWKQLNTQLDQVLLNGPQCTSQSPSHRLAGNLNVSFGGVDGDALMTGLSNIAVSSGSACTSADPEPSHVLTAIGRADALTRASLRFGIGRFNTPQDADTVAQAVIDRVRQLRHINT
jgi:cysteine desulfurase